MAVPQIGIIWSENTPLSGFTSSTTPYEINVLKPAYQFCDHNSGTSSPSLPNYCSVVAGCTLGKTDDSGPFPFANTINNLFTQLQTAPSPGPYSWKTYEEGLYNTGTGGAFAARHCPAAIFNPGGTAFPKGTATTPAGTNNIRVDFTGTAGLGADIIGGRLPDYFFITPNINNDSHDKPISWFDNWLQGIVGPNGGTSYTGHFAGLTALLGAMRPNGIVIVGDDAHAGGSPFISYLCIVTATPPSPVPPVFTTAGTHYSTLWAIQQAFGLPKFTQRAGDGGFALDSRYTSGSNVPIPFPSAVTDTTAPSVPTALHTTSVLFNSVTVAWTASTDNVDTSAQLSYDVQRNGVTLGTTAAGVVSFTDSTVAASTSYTYRVRASDRAGNNSAFTATINVTTPAATDTTAPTVPTGLAVTLNTVSTVAFTWNASTDIDNPSSALTYTIFRGATNLGTTAAGVTSFTDNTVQPGTAYAYTVRAQDPANNQSAASAVLNVTTPPSSGTGALLPWASHPPAGNTGVSIDSDGVDLFVGLAGTGRKVQQYQLSDGTLQAEETTDGVIDAIRLYDGALDLLVSYTGDCAAVAPGLASGTYNGTSCGVNGTVMHKLFKLGASNLSLSTDWTVPLTSGASQLGGFAIETDDMNFWIGGDFTNASGANVNRFAAYTGVGEGSVPPLPTASVFAQGATSAAITPDPTTQTGDLMLAQVTLVGTATVSTVPAGWTLVTPIAADGTLVAVGLYQKTAGASENAAYTWSATAATSVTVNLTSWSALAGTPIRTFASSTSSAQATTTTPPTLSGLSTNDRVVVFSSSNAGPRPWPEIGQGAAFGAMPGVTAGHWCSQAGIASFEAIAGRKLAIGVGWPSGSGITTWDFSGGFPGTNTGVGPNVDFANNRITALSWFTENSPWPFSLTTADPTTGLQAIAAGTYDSVLLGNANTMKAFGHPLIFRLFPEQNGGDHPYEVGYTQQPAANQGAWVTAFVAAWKRIWAITKGTDADITAFAPGYTLNGGHSAGAVNAYFHWCPQTFETTATTRDKTWPGDQFVDLGGSEAYTSGTSSSATGTFTKILTDTSLGNATHVAAYDYNTPGVNSSRPGWNTGDTGSAGGFPLACGEAGPRWASTAGDVSDCVVRINSFLTGLKSHPGWPVFMWWDGPNGGGGTNNSNIESWDASGVAGAQTMVTAIQNFIQDPWMAPSFNSTWQDVPGWSTIYQNRRSLGGAAKTNIGSGMQGQFAYSSVITTPGSASVVTPQMWGFGRHASVAIALVGA